MGECGCPRMDYRFPGPHGTVYALELYPGCHDCETPVGIAIHKLSSDDRQVCEGLPELPFVGNEFAEPLIEPTTLLEALKEYVGHDIIEEIKDCTSSGDLHRVLEKSVFATRKKFAAAETTQGDPRKGR
jgi:hypothetical protein